MAAFLIVAGFTGSVLAFHDEVEAFFAPELFVVDPPSPGARPMDPIALHDLAQARYGADNFRVQLSTTPGRSVQFYVEAEGVAPPRQVFVNPYTGTELGSRTADRLVPSEGARAIVPFIYQLHYMFAAGEIGRWAFGVAALIWTLDCFIGFYLTLPLAQPNGQRRSWFQRWRPAWMIRTSSNYKFNFDLHRAGGVWVWPIFFVFAWSSVGFNLRPVYDPVIGVLFRSVDYEPFTPTLAAPLEHPALSFADALPRARAEMTRQAQRAGFRVRRERSIEYDAAASVYWYAVLSSADFTDSGNTWVAIDGNSGALKMLLMPAQDGASRDTIESALFALHLADIGGLPYRIFVCLLGLATVALSVTGIIIWMRKRGARLLKRDRPDLEGQTAK